MPGRRLVTPLLKLPAALLALVICCAPSVPPAVPAAQRARYAALREAIEENREFNPHCWCRAYQGGLCGETARRALGLSPADVELLAAMGKDRDVQVVFGVVDMLGTIGEAGFATVFELMQRNDDVGATLRGAPSSPCRKGSAPSGSP